MLISYQTTIQQEKQTSLKVKSLQDTELYLQNVFCPKLSGPFLKLKPFQNTS